jgi:hypothetical protein
VAARARIGAHPGYIRGNYQVLSQEERAITNQSVKQYKVIHLKFKAHGNNTVLHALFFNMSGGIEGLSYGMQPSE